MTQGHFEGTLHAFRKSSKGDVVSFLIHPHEIPSGIINAQVNTRFMIGFSEIVDEQTAHGQGDGVAPPLYRRHLFWVESKDNEKGSYWWRKFLLPTPPQQQKEVA